MKIAVCAPDGKVLWTEAASDNFSEKVKETAGGDASEFDWERVQIFKNGQPLTKDQVEAVSGDEPSDNTIVVVLRPQSVTGVQQNFYEPITIYLRHVDSKAIKVKTHPTQCIGSLKAEVVKKWGFTPADWQLHFKGQILAADQDLLLQHHILNKSIVHVVREETSEMLYVKFSNIKTKESIAFSMKPEESIKDIRARLGEQISLNPQELFLVYCGGELADEKTAGDYHIASGAGIFLLVKSDFEGTGNLATELGQAGTVIKRTLSSQAEEPSPKRVLTYDNEPDDITEEQPQETNNSLEHSKTSSSKGPSIIIPTTNTIQQEDVQLEMQSPVMHLLKLGSSEAEAAASDESMKGSLDSPGFSPLAPTSYDMKRKNTSEDDRGIHHGTTITLHSIADNVEGVDSINEISDQSGHKKEHNPLADARIIDDKGYQVKQVESIIISEPKYNMMQVRHVESMIERSEDDSRAESFLDDQNQSTGNSRTTQSLRQKPSETDKKNVPTYASSIQQQPASSSSGSKLYKNVLSESIELEPRRIVIRRANGLCFSHEVTPMETVAQLKKRLEGHHSFPAEKMTLLLGGKALPDDTTFVELRLLPEAEFQLELSE